MKSMRKSLAFLVVLAMVLSCVAPVFAATPADVEGTDYESAVGNLAALGIISGDKETGNYRPNDSITRAEFAKIACYLLGMQAAGSLGATTQFKDVPASHWASGFVALAAGKGIIKGYPGGLFKPEEPVTYAEAITILVRAIGMGEFVEKQGGTWPSNYMAAGSMAGITSDVAGISSDGKALRGIIAQLSWNTLASEKWGPKEYTTAGITYGPTDKSLMEELYKNYVFKNDDDKYQIKWFEDIQVTGTYTSGLIDADQIKIDASDDDDLGDMLGDHTAVALVDLAEGINTSALYGMKIDALFGKDDKIVNLRVATPAKNIVKGFIAEYKDEKLSIKSAISDEDSKGTKYSFCTDGNFKVFINSLPVASTKAALETAMTKIGDSNASVTAILKSGNIETLKLTVCDVFSVAGYDDLTNDGMDISPDNGDPIEQFVVADITKNNVVKNVAKSRDTMFDLDSLSDANKYVILKNGKAATKADIKVGDVLTIFQKDLFTYILASDNKVTGKLKVSSDVKATNDEPRKKLTIDGKVYRMVMDGSAAYSSKASMEEEDVNDEIDDMNDFVNKEATLYLNMLGDVVYVSSKISGSGTSDLQIGVVTRKATASGDDYSVKILGQDGVVRPCVIKAGEINVVKDSADIIASGNLENEANYVETELDNCYDDILAGSIVVFELSADNKIDAGNFYLLPVDVSDPTAPDYAELTDYYYDDFYVHNIDGADIDRIIDTTKKIKIDTETYSTTSSTSYLNADLVDDMIEATTWDGIVKTDYDAEDDDGSQTVLVDSTPLLFVSDEDEELKSIVFNAAAYLSSDTKYGIYLEDGTDGNDPTVSLLVGSNEPKPYTVNGSVYSTISLEEGDLVSFEIDGEGKYDNDTMLLDLDETQDMIDENEEADEDVIATFDVKSWDKAAKQITFMEAGLKSSGEVDSKVDLSDKVVVYDCSGDAPKLGSIDDISGSSYVYVEDYDEDDFTYGVVVIVR